jgi:PST family polysaccharide transporter
VSVKARLARGTAWISAAGLLTNALGFVTTLVLARLLLPADFGLVALATTLFAVISSITDFSVNSALIHHSDPSDDHFSTAFTISALRGALIGGLLIAASKFTAGAYHDARLVNIMWAYGGSAFLAGLANPRVVMMAKSLIFWQEFLFQVGGKLAGLVVSVTIAVLYHSYWALVWGAIATQALSVALSYLLMPFWPRLTLAHGRTLFSFSIWLSFGQVLNSINWNIDQFVVGTFIGKAPLGFYTIGNNLAVLPTREVTRPITTTLFPAFSQLKDDKPRLAAAYQSAQALVSAIALPAGVGLSLIARPLIVLTMGAKWLPSVFMIQVLASVFAVQTLGTLSQPLAMGAGETQLLFKRDLQSFAMRVPIIVAGVLLDGLAGIIWARLLTGSFSIIFHMMVVRKITGLSLMRQLSANLRSLISVAAMAVVVAGVAHFSLALEYSAIGRVAELVILVAAGLAAYVGCHLLCWLSAGRPEGPETTVLRAAGQLLSRLDMARA